MEKETDYPAIVVINDLPQDIFSDYLIGRGHSVERLTLQSALKLNVLIPCRVVLVVNGSDSDAEKILSILDSLNKSQRPILISCSGGRHVFQPNLKVWYGVRDCDNFSFDSWLDFEEKLINKQPRQKKLLEFQQIMPDGSAKYQVVNYRREKEFVSEQFVGSINAMKSLSREYLLYLKDWSARVQSFRFPVDFNLPVKKLFKTLIIIPEIKGLQGLPLFKEGDRVLFEGPGTKLAASVKIVEEEQVVVVFDEEIYGRDINYLSSYSISPNMNMGMVNVYLENLDDYDEAKANRGNHNQPLDLIMGINPDNYNSLEYKNSHKAVDIFLDRKTDKILRDPSQVEALIDIMSPKLFSLLQGPAGTGKTFVCAVAIKQYFLQKKNILVLSHSNKGVDNLLEEIAEHIPNKNIFRFSNDVNMLSPKVVKLNSDKHYMDFMSAYTREEPVVMATTINSLVSNRNVYEMANRADVVFIDEATRSLFYEVLPAISKAQEKVILVGDERQLGNIMFPPPVVNVLLEALNNYLSIGNYLKMVTEFNGGLFLLAQKFLSVKTLRCNRRSLPNICKLVSDVFYEGTLEVGRFNPYKDGELIFYDTAGRFPDQRHKTSYRNPLEVNFLIKKFLKIASYHIKSGGKITDLVIIAPYAAQINLIKKRLRKHLLFSKVISSQVTEYNIDEILNEIVVTVDAMQGSERKIVFLSSTRSNPDGLIGFNRDIRRLNVALSRPQEVLVIVGDASTFLRSDAEDIVAAFKKIVTIINEVGLYKNLSEKTI